MSADRDAVPMHRWKGLDDAHVVHGFTGRHGGASPHELTLARGEGVDDAVLAHNWQEVLRTLHPRLVGVALADQVHGAEVITAEAPSGPLGTVGTADALVTTTPYLAVAVRVADCVPVLVGGAGGVAAIHAGWRGAAAGVVAAGVHALRTRVGGELVAAIGPCISGPRYEVGPEVVEAIEATGVPREAFARPGAGDRWWADVGAAVAVQLRDLGVRCGRVDACTTGPSFFSWRVDGPRTGRQAGVIAWCP